MIGFKESDEALEKILFRVQEGSLTLSKALDEIREVFNKELILRTWTVTPKPAPAQNQTQAQQNVQGVQGVLNAVNNAVQASIAGLTPMAKGKPISTKIYTDTYDDHMQTFAGNYDTDYCGEDPIEALRNFKNEVDLWHAHNRQKPPTLEAICEFAQQTIAAMGIVLINDDDKKDFIQDQERVNNLDEWEEDCFDEFTDWVAKHSYNKAMEWLGDGNSLSTIALLIKDNIENLMHEKNYDPDDPDLEEELEGWDIWDTVHTVFYWLELKLEGADYDHIKNTYGADVANKINED